MNAQRNDNDGKPSQAETSEGPTPGAPPPQTIEPAPKRPRKGLGRLLFLLLAVGAAVLLYNYWGIWEEWGLFKTAQTAPAAPPPPKVTVAKPIVRELVEWKEFTGQFGAVDSVDVRARVSGYLESINFTDGQIVKKGDLLIRHRAEAIRARARIGQGSARRGQRQARSRQGPARSGTAELRKKDYATEETYDERVAQVNTATATRDAVPGGDRPGAAQSRLYARDGARSPAAPAA